MWSGLPSWKGLLEELVDFMEECGEDSSLVKREIENGDLLEDGMENGIWFDTCCPLPEKLLSVDITFLILTNAICRIIIVACYTLGGG